MKLLLPFLLLFPIVNGATISDRNAVLSMDESNIVASGYREDGLIKFKSNFIPQDPYYKNQKIYSNYCGSQSQKSIALGYVGNIESTWDNYKGDGVTIAVIDSGLDINHPDFAGKVSNKSGYIYADYNQYSGRYTVKMDVGTQYLYHAYKTDSTSLTPHGTNVSGTALALSDSTGTVGIAPNANLLSLKIDFTDPSLDYAIRYAADNGAKVINMSLGMYAEPYYDHSEMKWYDEKNVDYYPGADESLKDALDYAYSKGCIVIAAAGNECTDTHSYPASNNHVIGVGALTYSSSSNAASFSNYNLSTDTKGSNCNVDITAPGFVIASSYDFDNQESSYIQTQGTSFSAPIVAGAAALWKQQNPNGTPDEFAEDLFASAKDIGNSGWDTKFGYGGLDIGKLLTQRTAATSIQLPESSINLSVGDTYQINPIIQPSGSHSVTYSSSNASIATVSSNGKMTALKKGTTTIVATVNDLSASLTVNVDDVHITNISLNYSEKELYVGESFGIRATITPSNASESYSFSSTDTTVAGYSKTLGDKVMAYTPGECYIVCSSASGAVTARCKVTVKLTSTTLIVDKEEVRFTALNKTEQLQVSVVTEPIDLTVQMNASTSNRLVATINSSYVITSKGYGECDITITANDKAVVVHVIVEKEPVPTPEDIDTNNYPKLCGGNILMTSSALLSTCALLSLIILIKKKKK